jgi:septum formation protein
MIRALICLGSASPRRAELLARIGVAHVVRTADIDESPYPDEAAEVYVLRMALEKAAAVLALETDLPVLAADTAVVVEGEILGKPRDEADGLAMLSRLSGREHQVLTAVALAEPGPEGRRASRLSVSRVVFRPTTETERQAYWKTGEPADKAGAYAIQGYAAAFIEHLEGSFSGVMGLPLFETAELLAGFGINIYEGWRRGA